MNFNKRVRDHINSSLSGKLNFAINRAIRKYGVDNFSFNVLEFWSNEETLGDRERYWIKLFNTQAPNGYNLTSGGEGVVGKSPETLRLMSINGRKQRHTDQAKLAIGNHSKYLWSTDRYRVLMQNRQKPVSQYGLDGNFIKTHKSRKDASAESGANYDGICRVLAGQAKTAGGFYWKE